MRGRLGIDRTSEGLVVVEEVPGRESRVLLRVARSNGEVSPAKHLPDQPAYLDPSLTSTELKVLQAHFFLDQVQENLHSEAAVRFNFDAFLAALRAVTLVLQAECAGVSGFKAWYEERQGEMRRNPELKLWKDLRDKSLHAVAPDVKTKFRYDVYFDSQTSARVEPFLVDFEIDGARQHSTVASCMRALTELSLIVEQAREKGFLRPRGDTRRLEVGFRFHKRSGQGSWEEFTPPAMRRLRGRRS